MKKVFLLVIAFFFVGWFQQTDAHANAVAQTIQFDQTVSVSTMTKSQNDTYHFTVTKAGKVLATITSYNRSLEFNITDENGEEVAKLEEYVNGFSNASTGNGETKVVAEYLQPGTYTATATNQSDDALDGYRLKLTFKDSKTTEREPNNDHSTAHVVTLGAKDVVSQLSWNDSVDYYKVTMKQAGQLIFNVITNVRYMDVQLLDENLEKIKSVSSSTITTESKSEAIKVREVVEKGTYYVKVESNSTGLYKIRANSIRANNTEREPNDTFEKAQLIQLNKTKITGLISWNDRTDMYKVVVPKKTSVLFSMRANDLKLNASIYNSNMESLFSEIIGNKEVQNFKKVLPKGTYYVEFSKFFGYGTYSFVTAANFNPSVQLNTVRVKAKKITGKTEPKAKVTMYVNGKLVKTTTANSKGNYAYTHKKLRAKDKVKVIVTNTYGGKTTKQTTVRK